MTTSRDDGTGPLAGYCVLEFGTMVAALADDGAIFCAEMTEARERAGTD